MSKLKYLSLFSGIGAFEKALTNLNIDYDLVGFSEIDKEAIISYCAIHNVDESKNLGDISKINTDNIQADLITYGFACQDISTAGKQAGFKKGSGTRSSLLWEALRIIEDIKPKYAIAENVKNLLSKKFKSDFDEFIKVLESYGYNNYYKVLNANDFGIPQNRDRVFVVSIRKDVDNGKFEFDNGFEHNLSMKNFLENNIEQKYILNNKTKVMLERLQDKSQEFQAEKGFVYNKNNKIIFYKYPGIEKKLIKLCNINPSNNGQSGGLFRSSGLCPTLTTFGSGVIYREDIKKVCKITELEMWKLMGFTKEDYNKAEQAQLINTNGKSKKLAKLEKQAGNSIVVNVAESVIKKLL
jgi:DNA (cytosine-5)-methyltransferase 1